MYYFSLCFYALKFFLQTAYIIFLLTGYILDKNTTVNKPLTRSQ